MYKRVLHIGLHKTASTWLQRAVFPEIKNIDYLGDFSISNFAKHFPTGLSERTVIFSSEAACGYPTLHSFSMDTVNSIIRLLDITHLIIVDRNFNEWCLSLYFQTLNEGKSWSLSRFLSENRHLASWRGAAKAVSAESGVSVLHLHHADIVANPEDEIAKISKFVDAPIPKNISSIPLNRSHFGNLTILMYRSANFISPKISQKVIRKIIQGSFVGRFLDGVSWRNLSSDDANIKL